MKTLSKTEKDNLINFLESESKTDMIKSNDDFGKTLPLSREIYITNRI